jgi:predicted acetyltransferase
VTHDSPGSFTIRPLGPDDDLDALADLQTRAFGPMSSTDRARWRDRTTQLLAEGRYRAAFDGPRLAATAAFHDMRQFWLGRAVPTAGVASVKVAPEDRGRGIGRALMTELLELIAARGYPVSMLYPSTLPLYRSLGWELAGSAYEAEVPAASLRSITVPERVPLRRAVPDDAAAVIAVHAAAHAAGRDSGPVIRDEATVRHRLADPDLFSYLAADGYLGYRWHEGNRQIRVERAVAASAETARELWAVVAGHATIARTVRAVTGPRDPLALLLREPDVTFTSGGWMLRVVDAPAAVAARGFPPGLELAVPLRLEDPVLPANRGDWTLLVRDGRGWMEESRTAHAAHPLTLGARGFSALFAGTPVPVLHRGGLASGGDPGTGALLDAGFAATPFCLDYF